MASDGEKETADAAAFVRAERFVAAVQSRLAKDPASVPARLWVLNQPPAARRLWALRQQATEGSCDSARAFKGYGGRAACAAGWTAGCCVSGLAADSQLKTWQALGEMTPADARGEFVRVVDELVPEWTAPQPADAALLCTWTPDGDSDECAACGEAFTLLNRRHHCRRCLRLVCAVCSPHSLPLRIFSQRTARRQRLCVPCYAQVAASAPSAARSRASSRASGRTSSGADENEDEDEGDASTATSGSSGPPPAAVPLAVVSPSTAIHSGPLELLHAAGGLRKAWRPYLFVLLVRKGSLGMFPSPTCGPGGPGPGPGPVGTSQSAAIADDARARPAAVFKLSGYALRVRAQKRRPHQFRLTHASKKPLQLAAAGMDDLRAWLAALLRAIECANELERRGSADGPRESADGPRGSADGPRGSADAVGGSARVEKDFMRDAADEA